MAVTLQLRRSLNPKDDMITAEESDKDLSTERYPARTSATTHKRLFRHTFRRTPRADLLHSCEFNGRNPPAQGEMNGVWFGRVTSHRGGVALKVSLLTHNGASDAGGRKRFKSSIYNLGQTLLT